MALKEVLSEMIPIIKLMGYNRFNNNKKKSKIKKKIKRKKPMTKKKRRKNKKRNIPTINQPISKKPTIKRLSCLQLQSIFTLNHNKESILTQLALFPGTN